MKSFTTRKLRIMIGKLKLHFQDTAYRYEFKIYADTYGCKFCVNLVLGENFLKH